MEKRLDTLVTVALALAAMGVSGGYLYRSVKPNARAEATPVATRMRSWNQAVATGHQIAGDSRSPATLVVFADFQCPACRGFHNLLIKPLLAKYPHELRVVYHQFPLSYHAEALPAARAGECVFRLGVYREWVDLMYEKQDSLGIKSYGSFAYDLGIRDTARVAACARDTSQVPHILMGLKLGEEIGLRGTPTAVLNGWVLPRPPSASKVDSAIASARLKRDEEQ